MSTLRNNGLVAVRLKCCVLIRAPEYVPTCHLWTSGYKIRRYIRLPHEFYLLPQSSEHVVLDGLFVGEVTNFEALITPQKIKMENQDLVSNPLEPSEVLGQPTQLPHGDQSEAMQQPTLHEDSAMTKAETIDGKTERSHSISKRKRDDDVEPTDIDGTNGTNTSPPRRKGVASIRPEFLVHTPPPKKAEGSDARDDRDGQRKKQKGQNTNRTFGQSRDAILLCSSRASSNEFSHKECQYGENCRYEHDLRKYLEKGKREELKTFEKCPVWEAKGKCDVGWRCRFVASHSEEKDVADGRKEWVLLEDQERIKENTNNGETNAEESSIVNIAKPQDRINLSKRKVQTPKSDQYLKFLDDVAREESKGQSKGDKRSRENFSNHNGTHANSSEEDEPVHIDADQRAQYVEPPFRPSEKRRLYFGPETPVLAPLTTQGNLPFRRLCTTLGAQVTWSEMAMSLPLLQGQKSEWALLKAHRSELESPTFGPTQASLVPTNYDNNRDFKFGVQIAAQRPWHAIKATEIATSICPHLRAVDLNCGCPIDLVYRQGAGAALMDSPGKLEKMLRGMNNVSGEVPVQVKIRMGTKDSKPTADKLVNRLAFGSREQLALDLEPSGIAAVTLHGRSRQQRYTKMADWSYIAQCASVVKSYNDTRDTITDTNKEPDSHDLNPSHKLYFVGNGDCYSHVDYFNHIADAKVDSVMIARGALIKPWIFEEINTGQYLDKSSSERLKYIEQFVRYGLETWGSDELGIGTTRRFLLEWLSFACRYVPIGLLEHLPPALNDRPPAYKGRDELETLMASDNVKDWVKISEMFLGPAHPDFNFDPKHKSNSYDTGGDYTAEG